MPAFVRQTVEYANTYLTNLPIPAEVSFASATLPGSTIAIFCFSSNDHTSSPTVTDSQGQTYTLVDNITDGVNDIRSFSLYSPNSVALSTSDWINYAISPTTDDCCLLALEIVGVSSGLLANAAQVQLGVIGSTADAITTPTMALGSSPAIIVGFSCDMTGTNTLDNAPLAGSGYAGGEFYNWPPVSGVPGTGNVAFWEWQRFSNPGTRGCTWTGNSATNETFQNLALAFAELIFPPVPGSPNVPPGFQQHNALMVN
jgi:hypothetical protein